MLVSDRSTLLIALPSSKCKYSDIWDSRDTEIRETVLRILVKTSESIKKVRCEQGSVDYLLEIKVENKQVHK